MTAELYPVLSELLRVTGGGDSVMVTSIVLGVSWLLSRLPLFAVEVLAAITAFKRDPTVHHRLSKLAREMRKRRPGFPRRRK